MMIDLSKIYLYRMTHIENIPHILEHGITHETSPNANTGYKTIGDCSLISFRKEKKVLVTNGKYDNDNFEEIILGEYIPFYFGTRTPMLYVVQKGGNFVSKPTPPFEIVYCVSSVQKIIDHNLSFYFSNGHATDRYTDFYNSTMISKVKNIVDFDATRAKYWVNENDLDLKRRKEAEFLVNNDIPLSCLLGFVCYNENSKNILESYGINMDKIIIKSSYYF